MLGSIGIERLIPSPLQGAYNGGTNLRRTEEIGAGGRVTKTERDSEICGARSAQWHGRSSVIVDDAVIVDNSLGKLQ